MDKRVLLLDIETSPIIAYVWGLRDQNITISQIKEDWHLLAFAAKWLGEKDVIYADQRNAKDVRDDKALLKRLWSLLNEADIVITQNGVNFDGPRINTRFILHGMQPPKPYRHLDTYQIVKRVAQFTSNKLEYLTAKLCTKYKKLAHTKFPGFSLWVECLAGNVAAWNEMKKYNIHDVLSLEELYTKLRAWAPKSMPELFNGRGQCVICGSAHLQSRGVDRTKTAAFQKLQCQSCGKWQRGDKM